MRDKNIGWPEKKIRSLCSIYYGRSLKSRNNLIYMQISI